MVIIENNKVKELETIIKKSDRQLVDILRKILNIQVDKIIIEKRLKLKNISEYEFEVIKTKAKLENDNEVEIYFKPIKNSRIKESIFCYWCLIYEEEISDKKIQPEGDIFLNKVLISELTKKKYYQSVFLEIENNTYFNDSNWCSFFHMVQYSIIYSPNFKYWESYRISS